MTDPDRVGDYADTSFLRLRVAGAEGAAELARSGLAFGVLTDHDDLPVLLLTRDGPAPVVTIDADDPIYRIMVGDVASLVTRGVPGLVVMRDSRVDGILTADTIGDFLVQHGPVRSGMFGDHQLHGDPPVSPLTIICSTCRTRNTVTYFVAGQTMCSRGHVLTVAWD